MDHCHTHVLKKTCLCLICVCHAPCLRSHRLKSTPSQFAPIVTLLALRSCLTLGIVKYYEPPSYKTKEVLWGYKTLIKSYNLLLANSTHLVLLESTVGKKVKLFSYKKSHSFTTFFWYNSTLLVLLESRVIQVRRKVKLILQIVTAQWKQSSSHQN